MERLLRGPPLKRPVAASGPATGRPADTWDKTLCLEYGSRIDFHIFVIVSGLGEVFFIVNEKYNFTSQQCYVFPVFIFGRPHPEALGLASGRKVPHHVLLKPCDEEAASAGCLPSALNFYVINNVGRPVGGRAGGCLVMQAWRPGFPCSPIPRGVPSAIAAQHSQNIRASERASRQQRSHQSLNSFPFTTFRDTG